MRTDTKKSPQYYIGLMSGTSVDGVDAVLMAYQDDQPCWKTVATHSEPLSPMLTQCIHDLSLSQYEGADPIDLLGECDRLLGFTFGKAVNQLITNGGLTSSDISAIGSHGQTVRHRPPETSPTPFSLQIGDPNIIAWQTGITTVADFRRKDMAAGGQGAPLAPAFHQGLFGNTEPRILVNIGGISNITFLAPDSPPSGCDCGPGNTLLDAWILKHQQKPFDQGGNWARSGKVIPELLASFKTHPFLHQTGQAKSSGRETFNLGWIENTLQKLRLSASPPKNIQATLVELTVQCIADNISNNHHRTEQLFVCGGGAFNDFLMERLQENLPHLIVKSTAELAIAPDWVEAAGFAWLAQQRLSQIAAGPHNATGAKQATILGGVYLPC